VNLNGVGKGYGAIFLSDNNRHLASHIVEELLIRIYCIV